MYVSLLTYSSYSAVAVLYWIEKVWGTSFHSPRLNNAPHTYPSFPYTVAAIIFTVIAIISVLAYFGYRARIPLATVLLQTVMDISKHHPSVYVVAFVALLVQSAVSVWFAFTAIATYERWTPGNPGTSGIACSAILNSKTEWIAMKCSVH